jgi:serine/threonine-protein kinase
LIRFQTEATAAGNLNHKNIVTVYEFGEDRGMFFLTMEYLAGQDLQKIIDSAGSVLDKMRIMTQIAEGLLCAHQGGVVHRDVKPANIMLLPDGTVKVMDFGIARLTRENSARLTQTGYLIGSVSHMAPE